MSYFLLRVDQYSCYRRRFASCYARWRRKRKRAVIGTARSCLHRNSTQNPRQANGRRQIGRSVVYSRMTASIYAVPPKGKPRRSGALYATGAQLTRTFFSTFCSSSNRLIRATTTRYSMTSECPGPDSNRHDAFRHRWILSPLCLPVSPPGHLDHCNGGACLRAVTGSNRIGGNDLSAPLCGRCYRDSRLPWSPRRAFGGSFPEFGHFDTNSAEGLPPSHLR